MEVIGKVRMVDTTKEVGNNGFRKRDIVVTTEEQYPQHISIQFVQDKVSLLDAFKTGDDVRVSINLRGREWVNPQGETVYFNTIQGWKIESTSNAENSNNNIPDPVQNTQNSNEENDNLPF